MTSSSITLTWSALDGSETAATAEWVRINVSSDVWIRAGFRSQAAAQLTLDLTLCEAATGQEASGATGGRFVVIPLDHSSVLIAVAMASDTPVLLTPLESTPAWANADGQPVGPQDNVLKAHAPGGAGLSLSFTPGREKLCACVVTISAIAEAGPANGGDRQSPSLSILRVEQERLTIAINNQ